MKIYALLILVLAVGCNRQASLNEAEQMQAWFPAHSSVADVRRIVEQHGFQCEMETNTTLSGLSGAFTCWQRSSNYFREAFVIVDDKRVIVRMHTMTNEFK